MLKRLYLSCLLFLGPSSLVQAQSTYLDEASLPYQTCLAIYQRLQGIVGSSATAWPTLRITTRKKRIAAYRSLDNTILLELSAYELCETFGAQRDAAIAFLLGHELAHYQQHHHWKHRATDSFLSAHEQGKATWSIDQEADAYGAFIAHLAGYATLELIPTLLEQLYEAYNLVDELEGYPSLKQRIGVVEQVRQKVQQWIHLYELAAYYNAFGQHLPAYNCYQYLLQFIHTKELYLNTSVVTLSAALHYQQAEEATLFYPLSLAPSTNFMPRQMLENSQWVLLKDAELHCKKALSLDSTYVAALLHLACIYDVQGELEQAFEVLYKINNQRLEPLQRAQLALLKGILYAHRARPQSSRQFFDAANRHQNLLPILYWSMTNKQRLVQHYRSAPVITPSLEDMTWTTWKNQLEGSKKLTLRKSKQLQMYLTASTTSQGLLTCLSLQQKGRKKVQQHYLNCVQKGEAATHRGIKIGDTLTKVQQAYQGLYFQLILQGKGFMMHYPSKGLVFKINAQEKVAAWAVMGVAK